MRAFPETWRDDLVAALTFLTRLPLRRAGGASDTTSLATASWAFPLVGVLVGVLGGIAYALAYALRLPALAAALIAIGTTALATGGLHEDGLADTADGLGGGSTREEKLTIMRDSRIGVYGVLALVFTIALRVAAIGQIHDGWRVLGALIAAHALARGLLPIALRLMAPARDDGLGAEAGRPAQEIVFWSCGIAVIVACAAVGVRPALSAMLAAVAAAGAIAWLARRQVGGYTGDVLGAIEQGAEVAALLAMAAWWR